MKAIFLDVDGVIATPTSVRLNYLLGRGPCSQWYDLVALTYLGRLVAETGAVVVLSSNWRRDLDSGDSLLADIMQNLLRQLEEAGAPMYDATPTCLGHDRSVEIGAWLDAHPCERYVIFDDLACFEERPEIPDGHLVLIEESEGIRYPHFWKALDILGGSRSQEDASL